jgi:NAD(P)-dependent dehydrogenase (short-subunit alcohol dehydrogenase family)
VTLADWCRAQLPSLQGRRWLVTGAAGGLGYQTAFGLASRGAEVWLADRNRAGNDYATARLRETIPDARLRGIDLDLGDLAALRRFAAGVREPLDGLVNNAGLLPPLQRATTRDGLELKFGVNVVGHFALTEGLRPALQASAAPRVVWVSSLVHRRARIAFEDLNAERGYEPQRAYNQAKLACLMLAMELHARSRADWPDLTAVAAHPGVARTAIGESRRGQPRRRVVDHLSDLAFWIAMRGFSQPAEIGARCLLMAAAGAQVRGGDFWGPDGFGEMGGEPTRVPLSKPAADPEQRARLWAACQMLAEQR